ncbi:GNAT family N-acetyltransferase [Lyngbya confervoides]|uniref:GNAT family N-acetyltransferase n=1 Tax=Lyngbya confervoides BDU141951 TaxID=1574623 RepID=A0ABD4SZR0_9CYAN|nr:GNAT family N-acetyltransferase [Lyngbya confervoides]MCM1981645.1 GNAT family N-acetyltransferase [Lyngbya confervoides BDU141951]
MLASKISVAKSSGRSSKRLHIRPATSADLGQIQAWALRENWNPGCHDLQVYQQQHGLFVGTVDHQLVGSIAALRYADSFGFIGCYLVDTAYRGRGYGRSLWNHALQVLAGATIGLEGAIAMEDTYEQSGFVRTFQHVRYRISAIALAQLAESPALTAGFRPVQALPFQEINAFDAQHFPCDRRTFLQRWLTQPQQQGLAYLQHGQVLGYGLIRPATLGHRLGPLFAQTPDIARGLISHLGRFRSTSDCPIFMDVPQSNPAALAMMEALQAQPCFSNCRMYRGTVPTLPMANIYGNTSLETG